MASKSAAPLALFLALNLLFFSMVSSQTTCSMPNFNLAPGYYNSILPLPTFYPLNHLFFSVMSAQTTCSPANFTSAPGYCNSILPLPPFYPLNPLFFPMVSAQTTYSLANFNLATGHCNSILPLPPLEAATRICVALKVNHLGIQTIDLNVELAALLGTCGIGVPAGFKC